MFKKSHQTTFPFLFVIFLFLISIIGSVYIHSAGKKFAQQEDRPTGKWTGFYYKNISKPVYSFEEYKELSISRNPSISSDLNEFFFYWQCKQWAQKTIQKIKRDRDELDFVYCRQNCTRFGNNIVCDNNPWENRGLNVQVKKFKERNNTSTPETKSK